MKHILETCKKAQGGRRGWHVANGRTRRNFRIAEGWQFIAIASELKMMLTGRRRDSRRS